MNVTVHRSRFDGCISVPGSKSHTIRACIFAALAEGVSHIRRPLAGEDCLSAVRCIREFGARASMAEDHSVWSIEGAGSRIHLPENVVDVGNSGSALYFLSPIAACFEGWSVFTGDGSIRSRPVSHTASALRQLGAEVHISRPGCDAPPLLIKGPIRAGRVVTDGRLSQYISGIMMAAARMDGRTEIELTDPKEIPYLHMTRLWLESFGIPVFASADWRYIAVEGPYAIPAFDRTVPSDWEAVAFPLTAAVLTDSIVVIDRVDGSGSQGDEAIVRILRDLGADIEWDREQKKLTVRGGRRLSAPGDGVFRINGAGFPDALPILCVAACMTEGTVIIEDIGVCRRKETDRIEAMSQELSALGAEIETGDDFIIIRGHSPRLEDGSANPAFAMRGGRCRSRGDHRVAMSLAVLGFALDDLTIEGAECCSVSFPGFFEEMAKIGGSFEREG